jgi:hypothetical protein
MSYPGFSLQVVRMIISSNIKWVGYAARMGVATTAYKILVGNPELSTSHTRSILHESGRSVNLTTHLDSFRSSDFVELYSLMHIHGMVP